MDIGDWKSTADHPQFATLMGQDTMYGWTEEGPDLEKMRANPAGRAWHS